MHRLLVVSFTLFLLAVPPPAQATLAKERRERIFKAASPFAVALELLQKEIGYTFENELLLRRAMTHSSYSEENNRALSILGESVIETSVALQSLRKDIDISASDLSRRMKDVARVESSCAADGMRIGLQKVVRVSSKTNSSTPTVVCGAFRAIFGAIAVDGNKSDAAGIIFWNVHGKAGQALAV